MKKQIFSIFLFALCVIYCGLIGCIKAEVPCEEGVVKTVDDGFIASAAKMESGNIAIYMKLENFYVQNGLEPYGDPPEISIFNFPGISGKTKKDDCGIYVLIHSDEVNNELVIVPCADFAGNDGCTLGVDLVFDTKFLCSPDKCPGTGSCVCVNPGELYESL